MSSPSPDVAKALFAQWVDRTVRGAYARGLNVKEIEGLTGIGSSTIDRWRNGQGGMPKIDRVRAFADGLGADPQPAFAALGALGVQRTATQPEIDPDLRAVARRLADPNTSAAEKEAIRTMLRLIARQPVGEEPRKRATG